MKKTILFFMLLASSLHVFSEDIELYLLDHNLKKQTKPQVLLIVDTSGSMSDLEKIKTPYDKTKNYGGAIEDIYYVVGSSSGFPAVDDAEELRHFKAIINNCSAAKTQLDDVGFYTGRVRQYAFEGNTGSWQEFNSTDGSSFHLVDCEDDINLELSANENVPAGAIDSGNYASVAGYPVDGAGTKTTPVYYDGDVTKADPNWGGQTVTLYTDNYLRWEKSSSGVVGEVWQTRLEIAKRTLKNLINSTPSVRFGLEVYNFDQGSDDTDSNPHGGRIAVGIPQGDADVKQELLDIFKDDLHASGWTPLCESYYEAYRYFAGLSVMYGDNDIDGYNDYNGGLYHYKDQPGMATNITDASGDYIAPFSNDNCSNKIFVIMITDGQPTNDHAADDLVEALKTSADPALDASVTTVDGNYLPVLSAYMATNDINADFAGVQTAQLYTVGFSGGSSGAIPLLKAAAENGGGQFYDATDPTKLGSKLQEALTAILSVNTSFTAPSVATNSFDRTETFDSAYYAMFVPNDRARWRGNLKKLKIANGKQVDRTGADAINSSGNIDTNAKTFWSTSDVPDGNEVTEGGVVGMFSSKTDARKVLTDVNGSGALSELKYSNMVAAFGDASVLHSQLGVDDSNEAQELLKWGMGIENETSGETPSYTYRSDVFGDPLHSKPVALNFGGSVSNPDIRILVGTNAGVLHMFKDSGDTVDESWAFMPKEFFSSMKTLRDNLPSSSKLYGIDGVITPHIVDNNSDGIINGDDKVWIFFGLRRGGSSYYGMDITSPDSPKLLWKIDGNTVNFGELGQTWSQPQVAYSKINIAGGTAKPVLIFGAGYSIAKDAAGPGGNDSVGRGIYMIDAETGDLKWSITPGAQTGKNTHYDKFNDSIPAKIGVLDSDSDGLVDRLYAGDTGGNVFRIDMPGADPFDSSTPWTAFKLAELGAALESPKTNLNDRRFYSAPAIVRTYFTDTYKTSIDGVETVVKQQTPYDAILIGSGDRTTPTSTDTNDEFFLIQDEHVITGSFIAGGSGSVNDIPAPIVYDDLYDFTNNPYGAVLSASDKQTLDEAVSSKSGWRFNFAGTGEKSTAKAIAVDGVAYFTSFTPGGTTGNVCELVDGAGKLYAIDLYKGTNIHNNISREGEIVMAGLPDTPVIVSIGSTPPQNPDPNAPPGKPPSVDAAVVGPIVTPLTNAPKTARTYQYVTENN